MSGTDPGEGALSAAQPSIVGIDAVRGHGAWIEGADGRAYLDLAAGIATCNLGHSHPAVIAAVLRPDGAGHPPRRRLRPCPRATSRTGWREIAPPGIDRFLFSTTGSEANEAALRLARTATGRPGVVCFRGSFHGRTPGRARRHDLEGGLPPGARGGRRPRRPVPAARRARACPPTTPPPHALAELDQLHRHQLAPEETACYMIEPVQGHGGCHPAGAARSSRAFGNAPTPTARCSSSTRSRPASAAPATGSPPGPTAWRPTS